MAQAALAPYAQYMRSQVEERVTQHAQFLAAPHSFEDAGTLLWPWLIQVVASWVAFSIYIAWDWNARRTNALESSKLPSRHPVHEAQTEDGRTVFWGVPLSAFAYNQVFMCPLVLYNQFVVWPLTSLLIVWPQWQAHHVPVAGWSWTALLPTFAACMLCSDLLWYSSHRLMHTPWAWRVMHKMHHIAPQCAISATYVHPWEYTLFAISMQLPFAIVGFPMWVHAVPLAWGMFTGSGAHSGYSGEFANGDKHNAHHYFHNVNFGLLMVADAVFGTAWDVGDPPPPKWSEADKIAAAFVKVSGTEEASTVKPRAWAPPGNTSVDRATVNSVDR
jgi:sterol desaturase/sphingolipid hydroxylase (fatty acid hydroxylase superfamily)